MNTDPFNLQRFVNAQDPVWDTVLAELAAGRKRGRWIPFVFPQLRVQVDSEQPDHYGISSLEEARDYLAHPLLGARLKECTWQVLTHKDKSAFEIFGFFDQWKFQSSMTLFERAAEITPVFPLAIHQFFGGGRDFGLLDTLRRMDTEVAKVRKVA